MLTSASSVLQLSTPDRVPFMFSASQKTVVLGLPLLRATFADRANKEQARKKKTRGKIERKKLRTNSYVLQVLASDALNEGMRQHKLNRKLKPQTNAQALVLLPLICYHIFTLIFGLAIAPRLRWPQYKKKKN